MRPLALSSPWCRSRHICDQRVDHVELGRLYGFVAAPLQQLPLSVLAGVMADRIGRKPLAIAGALTTALSIAGVPFTSGKLEPAAWCAPSGRRGRRC